ncbi:hypothetical protein FACS18942_01710 [Planctomycetales bacterium]|nr:hypothetical protein FACS18942_01710 [Planctomycetales bacterium]
MTYLIKNSARGLLIRKVVLYAAALFMLFFYFSVYSSAQDVQKQQKEAIDKRTAEIVKFLTDKPLCAGKPVTDRTAWETLANENASSVKNFIKEAEKLAAQPIPEIAEDVYKEFYKNGNRTNYQNARTQKYRRLSVFVFAECFENKGRFIKPLEEFIVSVCKDPSWKNGFSGINTNADND